MTMPLQNVCSTVPAALSETKPGARDRGSNRSRRILPGAVDGGAQAEVREGWIVLQAPLESHRHESLWSLLKLNSRLPGLSKVALLTGRSEPVLLAEIPLQDESSAEERIEAEFLRFKQAIAEVSQESAGSSDISKPVASPANTDISEPTTSPANTLLDAECDLQVLCKETGWSGTARDDGSLVVRLEVRREGSTYRARIEACVQGDIKISVPLARFDALSRLSRNALGIFMLRASGSLRFVRASIARAGEQQVLGFEVRLPAPPGSQELNHALSALSVACGMCGRESEALREREFARTYLRSRGLFSPTKRDIHTVDLSFGEGHSGSTELKRRQR